MKKILILLAVTVCCFIPVLTGCGKNAKISRQYADKYLETLTQKTRDTLLIKGEAIHASRSSDWMYTVNSEAYKDTFTVCVHFADEDPKAEPQVYDDYYILSAAESAEKEVNDLFRQVTGDEGLTMKVNLHKYYTQDSSMKPDTTLTDLFTPDLGIMFLDIYTAKTSSGSNLSEETVDQLIRALLDKGWYSVLYPYASDSVWFEVAPNGTWKTVRTGADNGALLERTEYELK